MTEASFDNRNGLTGEVYKQKYSLFDWSRVKNNFNFKVYSTYGLNNQLFQISRNFSQSKPVIQLLSRIAQVVPGTTHSPYSTELIYIDRLTRRKIDTDSFIFSKCGG